MDSQPMRLFLFSGFPYAPAQRVLAGIRRAHAVLSLAEPEMPDLSRARDLIVEAHPAVEPGVLVETWRDADFLSCWLQRPARMAGVVALLDSPRLEADLRSRERLADRGWMVGARDGRTVADLLVEQIEAASTIALLDPDARLDVVRRQVRALNPTARIVVASAADDDLPQTLIPVEEPAFQPTIPPWLRALRDDAPFPESFRDGGCVVYRRQAPFDPERLASWLDARRPDLLRAKGQLWIDDRWDERIGYSRAGSVQRTYAAGAWWASAPNRPWPIRPEQREKLLLSWHPRFGDRQQQIVLLGLDLDTEELVDSLDACLIDRGAAEKCGWSDRLAKGPTLH